MSRLAIPRREALNPQQQALFDAIAHGPRGPAGLTGPFAVWMHNPEFGVRAQEFGAYVRYRLSLPLRIRELAIMVCARHWGAQYEWYAHEPIASGAGVPPDLLNALHDNGEPTFTDEHDRVTFRFCRELLHRGKVSDEVYAQAKTAFGEAGVVELVGVLGYYTLIALTVQAFEVGVDDPNFRPLV